MMIIVLFAIQFFTIASPILASSHPAAETIIQDWEVSWDASQAVSPHEEDTLKWLSAKSAEETKPKNASTMWVKFKIPEFKLNSPGILINKAYAQKVTIYFDGRESYHSSRNYRYDVNKIFLPLNTDSSYQTLYMKLESKDGRIGIPEAIILDEYQRLLKTYMQHELIDIIIGGAFIFIAICILACSGFVSRDFFVSWIALSLIILSVGVMIVTYSPFLYSFYGNYGRLYYKLFDVAQSIMMPAIFVFIDRVLGAGPYGLIRKASKFLVIFSLSSVLFMIINLLSNDRINELYFLYSVTFYGFVLLASASILLWTLVYYCLKGNKEAYLLSLGLGVLMLFSIVEIIWFYAQNTEYELFLWKWGIVCFVLSLIMIFAKRIAHNHQQLLLYSKKLEMYNVELQRSEKMEIISQLAASIAHEVRNPLQVTRGFLQLLHEKSIENKERSYITLSIEELDRASEIITDFLTFAKPQTENAGLMNISQELEQIVGILIPLANLQGGKIIFSAAEELYVRGQSSKFKQGLINIIKNSIEALRDEGKIEVWAYESNEEIIIKVRDDGEGMTEDELKKLGEPYFSKKSKGTGLGLMVTFRIIEGMQGIIHYNSIKGKGTEAVIHFPSAKE
ncbi:HAMP domain-containing sensor histidine kinase [Paenibacillus sp. NEAU-GSW1]|uniref:sensor histidine kinase n=1 Tax=Paenibacillus sp. NEAU-GSW1 TaxID=2682486 RepID=UPI001C129BB2|nr:HAMP domain-containing sensor histidine kinase [Paenibacillus sp. NEAU-GSW1]